MNSPRHMVVIVLAASDLPPKSVHLGCESQG
jgi:hypothetical protein